MEIEQVGMPSIGKEIKLSTPSRGKKVTLDGNRVSLASHLEEIEQAKHII